VGGETREKWGGDTEEFWRSEGEERRIEGKGKKQGEKEARWMVDDKRKVQIARGKRGRVSGCGQGLSEELRGREDEDDKERRGSKERRSEEIRRRGKGEKRESKTIDRTEKKTTKGGWEAGLEETKEEKVGREVTKIDGGVGKTGKTERAQ